VLHFLLTKLIHTFVMFKIIIESFSKLNNGKFLKRATQPDSSILLLALAVLQKGKLVMKYSVDYTW